MALIKINGKDYEFDQLSEKAKAQLNMLRFVDTELQRLKAQAAVLQMARVAYGNVLLSAVGEKPSEKPPEIQSEKPTLN